MDARKLIINSWLQYDITRSIAIHHVCEDMNPYIYCLKWFSSFMGFVYICLFKRSINVFTGKLILFFICWGGGGSYSTCQKYQLWNFLSYLSFQSILWYLIKVAPVHGKFLKRTSTATWIGILNGKLLR